MVEEGVCEHRGTSLAQGEENAGQQVVRKQEVTTSLPQESVTALVNDHVTACVA